MKHVTINLVKFKALGRRLGRPMFAVVGVLESLWVFCQIQARDGDLSKFSTCELAGWIEWDGDEDHLIESLVETGWLDRTEDGRLVVHDWDAHKPNWLKGVDSREKSTATLSKGRPSPEPSPVPSSGPSPVPSSGPSPVPTPLPPNLTQPNPTKPNPTKEKKNVPDSACGVDPEPPPPEEVILTIPSKRSDRPYPVTASTISYLADLFPHLDVVREVRKAAAWAEDNPSKRKTASGMRQFLTRWMEKARGDPAAASGGGKRRPFNLEDFSL